MDSLSNPASRKSSGKGPKYQPPSKRPAKPVKQFDRKKWGERFNKLGAALKPLAFSHPVVLGLGIMTLSTAAHIILDATAGPPPLDSGGKSNTRTRHGLVDDRIQGLYNGSYGIAMACAAVPIVSAVAQVAGSVLTAKAGASSE